MVLLIKIRHCGHIGSWILSKVDVCYATPTGFQGPYIVAVADLEEGGRVMGNVINADPTTVSMEIIGKIVRIGYKEIPGDYMTGGDNRFPMTFELVN